MYYKYGIWDGKNSLFFRRKKSTFFSLFLPRFSLFFSRFLWKKSPCSLLGGLHISDFFLNEGHFLKKKKIKLRQIEQLKASKNSIWIDTLHESPWFTKIKKYFSRNLLKSRQKILSPVQKCHENGA